MSTYLSVRSLKKHFGDNRVLDGVDLDVSAGSVTTIIGKSGIGKSVFLKCIADLLTIDSGTVEVNETDIDEYRKTKRKGRMPFFSYMFQNNALFDSLSVLDNISLPLRETTNLSKTEISERVQSMLEKLDLIEARSRYPGELSGGMNKRVAFGRALITEPELVLFDEPTTGLDPERKFGVFKMIADYREQFKFTALVVSHAIPDVFEVTDQVVWLDSGHFKFKGTPSELSSQAPEELREFLKRTNFDVKNP